MDNPQFDELMDDVRFSLGSLLAVWMSLFVPAVVMAFGVLAIGGGLREAGAVVFAAAIFSAADWLYLVSRIHGDADRSCPALAGILDMPVTLMARALSRRYL